MDKVKFLKEQYGHLPAQGTDAWRESRRTKVGGSEMAAVLGKSPYIKSDQIIARKKCDFRLDNSAACTFGRVFEDVALHHIEVTEQTKVHHLGAIPSSRFPVVYSPDGVIAKGDDLVLVEIKCPFRRSKIEDVPAHYLCQVLTGMCVLPCVYANFYQFRFRCCRVSDLGPSQRYNRWLHFESRKRCPDKTPLAWGFLHWDEDTDLIDLGALGGDASTQLCFVNGKEFTIHHGDDQLPLSGYVLPWKLFEFTVNRVERQDDFLISHEKELWAVYKRLIED